MTERGTADVTHASFSAWRAHELTAMGFEPAHARRLADARGSNGALVPLHDIRKALHAGCPHDLALRIWL